MRENANGIVTREKMMAFIDNYWKQFYISPTIQDVATFMGFDLAVVHYHVKVLRKNGKLIDTIKTPTGQNRGIIPHWVKNALQDKCAS